MKLYVQSSLIGMSRVIIGFPLEHPIDAIKVQWQSQPQFKNEFEIIRHIYQCKGMRGFYVGSLPNLTRLIARNSYKYPLLIGLPQYYKCKTPEGTSDVLLRLMTGFSVAAVEATITCPIERTKVYLMTNTDGRPGFFEHISK